MAITITEKLGNLVEILSGFAFKSSLFSDSGGIPIIRIRDVVRGKSETFYKGNYDPNFIVKDGDILIGMDGEFNCARWQGGIALLNQRVCKIKSCDSKLDERYLLYFLPKALKQIEDITPFVTVKHLSVKSILDIDIPFPPIAEQRRVAAILDKTEELRELRRQTLRELDAIATSIFLEIFGHPVTNSKGWPLGKLKSIAKVERGKFTPRPRNDPSYYDGDFPFIQTGDISSSGGRLRKWSQTLNVKGATVSRSFPPGTVVIAIVGATLGITSILEVEVYCPDSVIGIQAYPDKSSPEYIERVLRFWRPIFVAQAPETARANINLETLRPLEIPIPPVKLQKEFAQQIQKVEQLKTVHRDSLTQLDALFASLHHRAFCGEL